MLLDSIQPIEFSSTSADMILFSLINRTASNLDMSSDLIDNLYILETILLVWSYFECGVFFYVLCTNSQYHPNLTWLLKNLVAQYFISMACRLFQIYFQYGIDDESNLKTNWFFILVTFSRNCLIFTALYFSPFVMMERLYASVHIGDYEHKPRHYVGYTLSLFLYLWSLMIGLTYAFEVIPTYIHVSCLVSINMLAFVVCLLNESYNSKKFVQKKFSTRKSVTYSLSERYQIVENLKTAYLFKRGIISIIIFSVICGVFLVRMSSDEHDSSMNWILIGFNYAAILYGIGFPAAMFFYDQQFQKQLLSYIRMIFCISSRTTPLYEETEENSQKAKISRSLEAVKETDIYFNNLKGDWEKMATKSKRRCEC
ncbi:Protein CBR-SRE-4 [Caenorhabditis briggsae]|uniref:Uncharacterized protein n=3 Tax=Caenorhabditis briggsae TaxID=6238 RepID=A0AAE9D431_CAEBR|nr:Protein CBR-SRE-4 [Caenorhabditis briggsae]ULT93868.1 hypothetical protein L3Y34_003401 [Caenorhabditis briggsae]CAP33400.2 Protein CBR-SRE-4 [Caenorhabditis briggsae]